MADEHRWHYRPNLDSWPKFVCSYKLDGESWSLTISAKDFDDARRRVRAIGITGQVDGEQIGDPLFVPTWASGPMAIVASVVCWVPNCIRWVFGKRKG